MGRRREKCAAGAGVGAGRERERRNDHRALNVQGSGSASSVFAHERNRAQLRIPAVFFVRDAGKRGLILMCTSGGRPLNRLTPDPANEGDLLPNGDGQHDREDGGSEHINTRLDVPQDSHQSSLSGTRQNMAGSCKDSGIVTNGPGNFAARPPIFPCRKSDARVGRQVPIPQVARDL